MNTARLLRGLAFGLFLPVMGSVVEAQVWSLAADYSSKTNPVGAWSYGYRRAATPPSSASIASILENTVFNLYTNVSHLTPFYNSPAWSLPGSVLSLSKSYAAGVAFGAAIPGPQDLAFENTASSARWTAPEEADYHVRVEFVSNGEYGKVVTVLHNGRVSFLRGISGAAPMASFETNYHLMPDEFVEFAVVNRPYLGGYIEQTLIDATVTLIARPLVLTIQFSDVDVCWTAQTNKSYQAEYQSSLTTNTWLPLGPTILGTGSRTCIVDSIREPAKKFYRVREL
ncbi:MAG: hypothetical protein L0Z50_29535 [Verrucomicrobiales bacterium]|nr:hypothetical protein [Verrucomicrobiales bacterium]